MTEEHREPEKNPYEAPQTAPSTVAAAGPPPKPVTATTMILVSIALLLGIISFFPLVGIFFLICSIPVYVRFSLQHAKSRPVVRSAAGTAASVGVGLSVLAAGMGACFGTCHATGAMAFFALYDPAPSKGSEGLLSTAMVMAPTMGVIAAAFAVFKLWPLTSPRYASALPPPSIEPKATEPASLTNKFADPPESPDKPV